ncbi:hypothetical protein EPJ66_06845 [Brachyspira aalborgi]|uniref:hypothetical protein n=1 Tax=Brachyspira aalborgi TaxID=29522 RepID=UPI0011C973B7|nr:hypothetical protein [Brachyspira aalborgi]TXJ52129.1 hypothetical protein EPJ66_06845 [Brachyspira aalborgi]
MKEQTKKFYLSIILSLIALFLISCDNKDKTGAEEVKGKRGTEERTLSYYAGNWYGKLVQTEMHLLTINTDGSFTIKGDSGDTTIPSSSVTRVSDTTYTALYSDNSGSGKFTLVFTSDIQGNFIMGQEGKSNSFDITKK